MELIRKASPEVQRAFYEALMADVAGGTIPSTWRTVLYTLLVKPWPNNPNVIGDRREIALMPQDLKLFLQMVRSVAHKRLVGRLCSDQLGWLKGFSCTDSALMAAAVIDQARRLQQPLWVLYIDLATMFPSLDRRNVQAAEFFHGLPTGCQRRW